MTLPPDDIVSPGELDGPSSQEKDILVSSLTMFDVFCTLSMICPAATPLRMVKLLV